MFVSVIGCGCLGIEITTTLLYYGYHIRIFDNNEDDLNKAHSRIIAKKNRLIKDEKLNRNIFDYGTVSFFSSLSSALKNVTIVLECITENLELKRKLFAEICNETTEDVILTTNSMFIHPRVIANENKELMKRLFGMRFLYPVFYSDEVQFVMSEENDLRKFKKLEQFVGSLNKLITLRSSVPKVMTPDERDAKKIQWKKDNSNIVGNFSTDINKSNLTFSSNFSQELEKIIGVDLQSSKKSMQSNEMDASQCVICMDNKRDTLIEPCHHFAICSFCAENLRARHDHCPICRGTEISKYILISSLPDNMSSSNDKGVLKILFDPVCPVGEIEEELEQKIVNLEEFLKEDEDKNEIEEKIKLFTKKEIEAVVLAEKEKNYEESRTKLNLLINELKKEIPENFQYLQFILTVVDKEGLLEEGSKKFLGVDYSKEMKNGKKKYLRFCEKLSSVYNNLAQVIRLESNDSSNVNESSTCLLSAIHNLLTKEVYEQIKSNNLPSDMKLLKQYLPEQSHRLFGQLFAHYGMVCRIISGKDEMSITHHYEVAALFGNEWAKKTIVQQNPYAALCNSMLNQMMAPYRQPEQNA
ncbi:hypothetical protein SNEBB_008383 [Seison nebaliae]|nr:hypothetical protein SNEBB_008383 [Seison nebaliae]